MKKQIALTAFLLPLVFTACEVKIPIREMVQAKKAIARAEEVQAKTYAPEELKAAQESLLKSNHLSAEEKVDDAKKAAQEAMNQAKAATAKALPLLAADSLSKAQEAFDALEPLNAPAFAPTEYTSAGEELATAKTLNKEKSFWQSHISSLKAQALSAKAKSMALMEMPALMEKAEALTAKAASLEKKNPPPELMTKLGAVKKDLAAAKKDLEAEKLKTALATINKAEKELTDLAAAVAKDELTKELAALTAAAEKVKGSPGKIFFPCDCIQDFDLGNADVVHLSAPFFQAAPP